MRTLPWAVTLILLACRMAAAVDTAPAVGLRENTPENYALVGAKIIVAPGQTIESGTVVIRDGKIDSVATGDAPPDGLRRIDLKGKIIYPGFIDSYTELAVESAPGPGYWNGQVTPQRAVATGFKSDEALNKSLRSQGFTARVIAPKSGIIKGQSAVVLTADGSAAESVINDSAALHVRLTVPFGGSREYPNSPMGAVALARQAMYDAQWFGQAMAAVRADTSLPRPDANVALAALGAYLDGTGLIVADAPNELFALRADRYAREFSLRMALLGSGNEYRQLDAICDTRRTVIVPVDFPKPPEVASPAAALDVSLEELMHWRLAPENPGRLANAGVPIALTTAGLSDRGKFLEQLRKAVERGLAAEAALRALTTTPAELFAVDHLVGTIEVGKIANLVIADGDLFASKSKIVATWVNGRQYELKPEPVASFVGKWLLKLAAPVGETKDWILTVTGEAEKPTAAIDRKQDEEQPKEKKPEGDAKPDAAVSTEPDDASDVEADKYKDAPQVEEAKPETESPPAAEQPPKPTDDVDPDKKTPEAEPKPETVPDVKPKDDVDPNAEAAEKEEQPDAEKEKSAEAKPKKSEAANLKPVKIAGFQLTGVFDGDKFDHSGKITLSATRVVDGDDEQLSGFLLLPDGRRVQFTGERDKKAGTKEEAKPDDDSKDKEKKADEPLVVELNYPLGTYGLTAAPEQTAIAFTGATVWTSGPDGTLENATVLIENGKIVAVGKDIEIPEGVKQIDCGGKHLTPGLIDCHSHIATDGGINESGQAITAEVRVGDMIDSDDINIYLQLAGGVTTSNILHGSANPIGGQNQVIKLRWGKSFDDVKLQEAPPGIKFALGENVKQSNWSDRNSRYPQTRMGVDELMIDEFEAALVYRDQWQRWERDAKGLPPRRDLELDAIVEILEHKRWVHCHSYRQSEILAILKTFDRFGIRLGTLQHILEGYKLAPEMAARGVMGSSFSDWWAYKFEVYDAIPFNGALMHQAGIVVSFNSDDPEMARRLNQEAAKATKYGGVPPEEALKFVTLNPAKQLRIEQYVGSIEPGKHADLAVWSGPPMSTYSRCEQTWIDGRRYFDLKQDQELRKRDDKLRTALVQAVLNSDEEPAKPDENRVDPSTLWNRHDEFCTTHTH
ncbi:MAG: amidohydrolase family protein [Pirellulales bacterium]